MLNVFQSLLYFYTFLTKHVIDAYLSEAADVK